MHRFFLQKTNYLIAALLFCIFILNLYLFYYLFANHTDIMMTLAFATNSVIVLILSSMYFRKIGISTQQISNPSVKISDLIPDDNHPDESRSIDPGIKELKMKISELKSINSILAKNLKSKNQLLKLVSHDLKAPLRNVIGLTDSIMRKYSGDIDVDLIDRLNRIKNNIEKEFHLISDILGDVRTSGLQNKPVDLNLTIRTIISQLSFEIQTKKVDIQIVSQMPVLKANGEILKHIFQNLIDNACKSFTDLTDNRIIIDCRTGQYEYIFSIKDNGPGIPAEQRENLFEFDTPANHVAGENESSGLGLPLVNTFINMINGKIWFKSKTGAGTIFYLSLPKVLID